MRPLKKLTLSALLAALGVTLLYVGSLFELIDLSVVAIVSLLVVFAQLELRSPYQWMTYIATALLAVLLLQNRFAAYAYALFGGLYPILKYYFEHLPRLFAWGIKLVAFNLMLGGVYAVSAWLFAGAFFPVGNLLYGMWALCNFAFVLYDLLLTRVVILYIVVLRKRIERFLR